MEVFGHQVLIATRLARFDGEAIVTDLMTIFMPLTFITGHYGMNFDTDSP